jgi:S-DNA-T family DNA segregation ATPase FtsK/SpoIIIE
MDIVIRTAHGEAEVSVSQFGDDVTLADLVERTTGRSSPPVVDVDGRPVPSATTLDVTALLTGSVIDLVTANGDRGPEPVGELVTVAGAGGGRVCPLPAGRYHIGPGSKLNVGELAGGSVSDVRIELTVDADGAVRDLAAPAGRVDGRPVDSLTPWRTGVLTVDDRAFQWRPADGAATLRRPMLHGADGSAAFNRPPRPAAEPEPQPLDVPDGGKEVSGGRRFPVLALLAPIPVAVGMAVVMGNPRFMLFSLLSPVMMLANWFEDRRSRRREQESSTRADAAAVAEFRERTAVRFTDDLQRRRRDHPTLADQVARARLADPLLWERRGEHDDAFVIPLGLADQPWSPRLERRSSSIAGADAIVAEQGPLPAVPVVVDLLNERGLGLVGDGPATRSTARGALLMAVTLHGPADVDVVICAEPERAAAWEWAKWLPHVRPGGGPLMFTDPDAAAAWAAAVVAGHDRPLRPSRPTHITLVVADGESWWRDRRAPLRPVLADPTLPVRFVALVDDPVALPAVCTTVMTAGPSGRSTVDHLVTRQRTDDVIPYTADGELALDVARALAPLDDPELPVVDTSALPPSVPILDVLGFDEPTPANVRAHWAGAARPPVPAVTLGLTTRAPLVIDLVTDGPHGLVAGTTGAGKSELLRSLVVGLAANLPPVELNVVLVDFKGGSAFDACADLPHTVALVTDLDEHLAGRVLRCLRAELTYREHVLRDAGVSSLDELQRLPGPTTLPRLLLVVDEFAFLAVEFPEFMPALVDIAQRGRSLGFHMVLATQRPAGVVDSKIKANTNLRIALRVQDDGDSIDVIGTRDAAALARRIPGRAFARLGAGELVAFQSAYATGTRGRRATDELVVQPYVVARELSPMEHRLATARRHHDVTEDAPSDLTRLVGAMRAAAVELGQAEQRRPYPEPLPGELPLDRLLAENPGDAVPFALADLPDEQRQEVRWWQPGPDGSMLVYGIAGSGTSSLLATLAIGLAHRRSPDDAHLYVIDADTNLLAPLDALPHTGAVVRLDDGERLARLVRHLVNEVERRRRRAVELGGPARVVEAEPAVTLLIDNVGALRQFLDDRRDLAEVWPAVELVIRDGRALGVCAVLTATQERAIPTTISAQIPTRLVMRLADQMAYTSFGLRAADVPTFVPGRALTITDRTELQIAQPPPSLASAVGEITEPAGARPPTRVDPLPATVELADLLPFSRRSGGRLHLPVGLDLRDVKPAALVVEPGSAAFVTGPSRSGRSTVLANVAAAVHRADPDVVVFSVAPRAGPLHSVPTIDHRASTPVEVAGWVDTILGTHGPRLVLIDDADRLGGPSFDRLVTAQDDDLSFVIAGRPDSLRLVSHWTRPLQQTRTGVLLRPTPLDGELLRVPLPTRLPRFAVGRGFLVNDGELVPLMVATAGA